MFMEPELNWAEYDNRDGVSAKLREWASATTTEAKAEVLIKLNQDVEQYVKWGQEVTGRQWGAKFPIVELAAKLRDFNDGTLSLDTSTLLILIDAKRKLEGKARELGDAYFSLVEAVRMLDRTGRKLDESVVRALESVRDIEPRNRRGSQPQGGARTRARL
jgi:hypothetical protein